jgi:cation:H+ antiporter
VAIEHFGSSLADTLHIGGALFAATFLAAATALPEISTGIASVKIRDYQLAFSDIFGGNAFMPALFIVGDIFYGKAVLSAATPADLWFAALGILLTGIYVIGLIVRPRKSYFGLGLDSIAVVVIYILSIIAFSFVK